MGFFGELVSALVPGVEYTGGFPGAEAEVRRTTSASKYASSPDSLSSLANSPRSFNLAFQPPWSYLILPRRVLRHPTSYKRLRETIHKRSHIDRRSCQVLPSTVPADFGVSARRLGGDWGIVSWLILAGSSTVDDDLR